jgi:hypothetical protein
MAYTRGPHKKLGENPSIEEQLILHVERGKLHQSKKLIEQKANVNFLGDNNQTPLNLAILSGSYALVELMLAHEADIYHIDSKGQTNVLLAASSGHCEIMKLLLDKKADFQTPDKDQKRSPLHIAANKGFSSVTAELIKRGADLNSLDIDGETPLLHAASGGSLAIVKQLLEAKADIHHKSSWGSSAAALARRSGHHDIANFLIKTVAVGDTPLKKHTRRTRRARRRTPASSAIEAPSASAAEQKAASRTVSELTLSPSLESIPQPIPGGDTASATPTIQYYPCSQEDLMQQLAPGWYSVYIPASVYIPPHPGAQPLFFMPGFSQVSQSAYDPRFFGSQGAGTEDQPDLDVHKTASYPFTPY